MVAAAAAVARLMSHQVALVEVALVVLDLSRYRLAPVPTGLVAAVAALGTIISRQLSVDPARSLCAGRLAVVAVLLPAQTQQPHQPQQR